MSDGVTHFVWLYIHGPDDGWELKRSIESVIKRFRGECAIHVVGDVPDWYIGHSVSVPRLTKSQCPSPSKLPYLDTRNKFRFVIDDPQVSEEFVWMMDDTFFLKDVTLEDLRKPRADRKWMRRLNSRYWEQCVHHTMSYVTSRLILPAYQYATHAPHVFEKSKLQVCIEQADSSGGNLVMLPEILYGCQFREDPEHFDPWMTRISRPEPEKTFINKTKSSVVLNISPQTFRPQQKQLIVSMMK